MTEQEYLDPLRFPLTTQKGLDLRRQKLIDAVNLDDLLRMQEEGRPLSDRQRAAFLELQEKRAGLPR